MAEIIRAHHWWWPILAEEGRADFGDSSFYGVKVVLGRELNCIDFEIIARGRVNTCGSKEA
ncbi:unnamed protein product [Prunus armeniaca]|uniref:Uncharacterized protein n=1 Tax=Prunus armeniaca TaxID=36596 RepID=A0A6J5TP23_PRUAR|nr:unnamed protein product [Prunus armeniaca]